MDPEFLREQKPPATTVQEFAYQEFFAVLNHGMGDEVEARTRAGLAERLDLMARAAADTSNVVWAYYPGPEEFGGLGGLALVRGCEVVLTVDLMAYN